MAFLRLCDLCRTEMVNRATVTIDWGEGQHDDVREYDACPDCLRWVIETLDERFRTRENRTTR